MCFMLNVKNIVLKQKQKLGLHLLKVEKRGFIHLYQWDFLFYTEISVYFYPANVWLYELNKSNSLIDDLNTQIMGAVF